MCRIAVAVLNIEKEIKVRKKRMNVDSEQITLDKSLVFAQDQPLSEKQLQECLIDVLGEANCKVLKIPS